MNNSQGEFEYLKLKIKQLENKIKQIENKNIKLEELILEIKEIKKNQRDIYLLLFITALLVLFN
ncbi:MAG: hypothetical protein AAF757_00835 [Cyanobacteria bacterium P01_D01_bin.116]